VIEFPLVESSHYPVQTAQKVLCFIEVSTLARNFADFQNGDGIEALKRHRAEIESITATMIENGYVNADNELFIINTELALKRANSVGKRD
jgi:hypothetical protein